MTVDDNTDPDGVARSTPESAVLKYGSGDVIRPGDTVEYRGVRATVEFVVSDPTGDPQLDWYVGEFGAAAMLADPEVFENVFVSGADIDDLVFVARSEGT